MNTLSKEHYVKISKRKKIIALARRNFEKDKVNIRIGYQSKIEENTGSI